MKISAVCSASRETVIKYNFDLKILLHTPLPTMQSTHHKDSQRESENFLGTRSTSYVEKLD